LNFSFKSSAAVWQITGERRKVDKNRAYFSAVAHDNDEREARGLYVEAAKIVRAEGCQQFKPFFTFGAAFNPLAQLFLTAEKKNALKQCFASYEAAAKFYDQILQKFPKTEIAILVEKERRLDSKSLSVVKTGFFPDTSQTKPTVKPPTMEAFQKMLDGLIPPLEPLEKK